MDEPGHAGFTLIELLLTLALVALLAALAAPAMSRLAERGRLRGAAEVLAQDLRAARAQALGVQQTVIFTLTAAPAGQWCYGWRADRPCDCRAGPGAPGACRDGGAWQRRRAADFPGLALRLPREAARFELRFSPPRALATAASVRLLGAAGEARVIVSPLGRVRVCAASGGWFTPC